MRLTDPRRQPPKYMGLNQAARYCNLSYRLIKEAVDSGRIPFRKFGSKTYRISRDELDEFMNGTDYQKHEKQAVGQGLKSGTTHDSVERLSDRRGKRGL